MVSKAVILDKATCERLKALGAARHRSPHRLMKDAIRQFVEQEETSDAIREDTLQRLADYDATGEVVPYEKIKAWLATWGTESETSWAAFSG